jgi:hypothetical protein
MDFTQAISLMERGQSVRRPLWSGYLFLDIDGNIKHAGHKSIHEQFWDMDTYLTDWEHHMVKKNEEEINTARIEELMDQNSSHIKRLYYLEDIIEDHHKVVKKLVDRMEYEMDDTKSALSTMVKFISTIKESMKNMSSDIRELYQDKTENNKAKDDLRKIIKMIEDIHPSNNIISHEEVVKKKKIKKDKSKKSSKIKCEN